MHRHHVGAPRAPDGTELEDVAVAMRGGCRAKSRNRASRGTVGEKRRCFEFRQADSHHRDRLDTLRTVVSHGTLMHRLAEWFVRQPPTEGAH
jgi:hypothetical protein